MLWQVSRGSTQTASFSQAKSPRYGVQRCLSFACKGLGAEAKSLIMHLAGVVWLFRSTMC